MQYDFELVPDEEWDGPQKVTIPKMRWPNGEAFSIIGHHLRKNQDTLQVPTRRVQALIGTEPFRRGIPSLDGLEDWESEQFWIWLMPLLYTSDAKQLNQYLEWLRQGPIVYSYRGHMAATDLHRVCKNIVRHRRRKGV